ncbi:MAG: response regulator transcription factor [Chitinophagaceae bacterium]|nr:response regulator transcription factor [Chitinophagaceae bacterium]MBK8309563.1 response regulator transcription factor [Chitinophagaceae bacterium]MBK8606382.1 response regulator transcription factor [Chitinophagaceae bacterium]MBP6476450.1 response regulator transcription factor [Chitinophagaceae bacterium]MBP7107793.1 response regulator transcription factor [Chitinophagaceae bacterium]
MIKSIIIDDETRARKLLSTIITDYCPELSIEAECEDLPSGIKAIKKYNPDIVFLDIEMPGHSGLELLNFFTEDEINFNVIFTTAYNEYAVQAFRFSAIDYLLKPIQHGQLKEAVQRYNKRRDKQNAVQLKNLKETLSNTGSWDDKRIAVPSGQTIHFFKPSEIIMIKGEAAYSEIHLANGNKMLASRNLRHFEEMLAPIPVFFRSHKSYIINRRAVVQYVKSDGGYLKLTNGMDAGLSPDKVNDFLRQM